MAPLTDQQREAIESQIFARRKIEAIKSYREETNCGLAEAKRAVEDMEVELRRVKPERFVTGANKSGCLGILAGIALTLASLLGHSLCRSSF